MDGRIILKWVSKNSGLIARFRIWTTEHSVWYIVLNLLFQLLGDCQLLYCMRCDGSRPTPSFFKLILSSPLKQLPHFYGRRRFITMLARSPPIVPILSQTSPVHAITLYSYFFTVYFNIILPCSLVL